MQSEGPYFITQERDAEIGANWSLINGPGIEDPKTTATQDYTEATVSVRIRNAAYADGRKAAEKEIEQMKANVEVLKRDFGFVIEEREKDFKELLVRSNNLKPFTIGNCEQEVVKFNAWKKARGIE